MSWCGGGEMSGTPGTEWRRRAISAVTLCPGSCPPSPGFEPWAILISSSSARIRYCVVTPKRADATCLIRLSARSPLASGAYVSGSSPPSPQFDFAGLRALGDLDFELVGAHQVLRRHAEARRCDLLDPVVRPVAVGDRKSVV